MYTEADMYRYSYIYDGSSRDFSCLEKGLQTIQPTIAHQLDPFRASVTMLNQEGLHYRSICPSSTGNNMIYGFLD